MHIVSLLPAATEICFALGLGNDIVGVSPECDYPPAAENLPRISRVLPYYEDKSSAETDRIVGERLQRGEALYEIDRDALRRANPDLILTQGLCEVCAPTLGDVRQAARDLPRQPEILSLDPHRLADILGDIERVGRATGVEDAASALVETLQTRIDTVTEHAAKARGRPRTLCLEWLEPPFAAGHWVPEMVSLAGGEDAFGKAGEKSMRLDPKAIQTHAPEAIVLMPCGFHMDRTRKEAALAGEIPGWRDLPAVRRDRAWLVDGSSYFSRPGPRVVDGLEILAHILHSDAFPQAWPARDVQPWVG